MDKFVYVLAFTRSHFEEALNVLESISRSRDPRYPAPHVRVYAELDAAQQTRIRQYDNTNMFKIAQHELADEANHGTTMFSRIVQLKMYALMHTLKEVSADTNVVWLDTDLFFKRDVRSVLLQLITTHAKMCAIFQRTMSKVCTGFFILPGNDTRPLQWKLLENTLRRLKAHLAQPSTKYMDDEACCNLELSTGAYPVGLLDERLFPDGNTYFNRNLRDNALIVHNNWILGLAAKIARFKEHGMWLVD